MCLAIDLEVNFENFSSDIYSVNKFGQIFKFEIYDETAAKLFGKQAADVGLEIAHT